MPMRWDGGVIIRVSDLQKTETTVEDAHVAKQVAWLMLSFPNLATRMAGLSTSRALMPYQTKEVRGSALPDWDLVGGDALGGEVGAEAQLVHFRPARR